MGFSAKPQIDECLEFEPKRWVIAGVSIKASLRPINTKSRLRDEDDDSDEESCPTTPTAKESRIPKKLSCPPAPRKRRPSSKCRLTGVTVRDFFVPPDLETVFKLHVKGTNLR